MTSPSDQKSKGIDPTLDDFMAFLACGFQLSDLPVWFAMKPEHRELMFHAAERLKRRDAALFGLAAQGMDSVGALLAPVDGGELQTGVVLKQECERVLTLIRGAA